MRKQLCVSYLAVALAVTAAPSAMDGKWKVNLDKSEYEDNQAPKSLTVTVSEDATTQHVHFDGIVGDDKTVNMELSFPLKGGPVEVSGAPPDRLIDHASVKVVSSKKWVFSYFSKDNKLTATRIVTVNGKMTEAKFFVKTPQGDKLMEDEVSELQ